MRGQPKGPAEAWFGTAEVEEESMQTTIERYNVIMKFLAKKCRNLADRETFATLILNLLPKLDSLDIATIEQMLHFLD